MYLFNDSKMLMRVPGILLPGGFVKNKVVDVLMEAQRKPVISVNSSRVQDHHVFDGT